MPERNPPASAGDASVTAAILTVVAPEPESGTSVTIGRAPTLIGRDPACALVLADRNVSRRHAVIRFEDDRFVVTDLGSANGTAVNGARIRGPARLSDGDQVSFADVQVLFHLTATATYAAGSIPGGDWDPDATTIGSVPVMPGAQAPGTPPVAHTRPAAHTPPVPGIPSTLDVSRAVDTPPEPGTPPEPATPPGVAPGRGSLRQGLHDAPGFSITSLLLAVLGSVVGTVLTGAAGTGRWGTLIGAAIAPVVTATFANRKGTQSRRIRVVAICILSLGALAITWVGFSTADARIGKSVIPGDAAAKTFPLPGFLDKIGDGTTGGEPNIEVSRCELDSVPVGMTTFCTLTVTSSGSAPLRVTRVEIVGVSAADFAVPASFNSCLGRALDPGRHCVMVVNFRPSTQGSRKATLIIHQNLPAPDKGTPVELSASTISWPGPNISIVSPFPIVTGT